jgi:hypothetical protein
MVSERQAQHAGKHSIKHTVAKTASRTGAILHGECRGTRLPLRRLGREKNLITTPKASGRNRQLDDRRGRIGDAGIRALELANEAARAQIASDLASGARCAQPSPPVISAP